jgi:hypothetical protein
MGNVTIGSLMAAIIWFFIMMVVLQPAITLTTPHSFSSQYFGVNTIAQCSNATQKAGANCGIINSSISNYTSKIVVPLGQQANSSSGFGAAANLQTFSGLAFIYGAFGLFYNTLTNLPKMIYILFIGSASQTQLIPLALATIGAIGFLGYISVSLILKGISAWMKSDVERLGE